MDIAIVKLGALGDVVRTLPILQALKQKYPDSSIWWITKESSKDILENNPSIDGILTSAGSRKFDILYNFDIDENATKLAAETPAGRKYGFYYDSGYPAAFNFSSEYYLNTLFDDEIKRSNKKTYQEMMFEVAELPYNKEHSQIYLTEKDKEYAKNFVQENNLKTENLIGIHMGAGSRWPSKSWSEEKVKEFIRKASENYKVLIFGGPNESEKHAKLISELREQNIKIYRNNPKNSIKEFASLVGLCKKMICSDSLALHISLALKKPTVGLFFCTSPNEVEDYGLLKKLVAPKLYEFFPEKMDQYDEELVNSISTEEVLKALESD